jgi:hypothetical protein
MTITTQPAPLATYALTVSEGTTPNAYAAAFLSTGRTMDPECPRSSRRLALALRILAEVGIAPVTEHSARSYVRHDDPWGREIHVCGWDAATGTECVTRWTAPVSTADLCAAWDLACEQVAAERR